MRDTLIGLFEKLVAALVVILLLGVIIGGIATMFSPAGGFFQGLLILVAGALYVILIGGSMYLFLGIHDNTKRTAAAVEALLAKDR